MCYLCTETELKEAQEKLRKIRQLCAKPDFKVGRLVKVDSLLEILNGVV